MLGKVFERVEGVRVLARGEIGRADLAPNLVLRVRRMMLDHRAEMCDGIAEAVLLARNATQLVMRVHLFRVNLDGPLETLARLVQLAALLVYQSEIVMRRSVRRIE